MVTALCYTVQRLFFTSTLSLDAGIDPCTKNDFWGGQNPSLWAPAITAFEGPAGWTDRLPRGHAGWQVRFWASHCHLFPARWTAVGDTEEKTLLDSGFVGVFLDFISFQGNQLKGNKQFLGRFKAALRPFLFRARVTKPFLLSVSTFP